MVATSSAENPDAISASAVGWSREQWWALSIATKAVPSCQSRNRDASRRRTEPLSRTSSTQERGGCSCLFSGCIWTVDAVSQRCWAPQVPFHLHIWALVSGSVMLAHGWLLCLVAPSHGHCSLLLSTHLVDFWLMQRAGLILSMSLTLASWRPSATHQPALWAKCISCLSSPLGGENFFTHVVLAGAAYLSGDALGAVIHIGMTFRKVLVV